MCSGQRAVKSLREDALPAPSYCDNAKETKRYKDYLERAIYTNFTGRTQEGLTGAAFRLPAEIDLPPSLEYLEENSDGENISLEQNAKITFGSLLCTGREFLLVDYPETEDIETLEDQMFSQNQGYIKNYSALDLINWKLDGSILNLAVLKETYDKEQQDEFNHDIEIQYRVLRLRDGVYTQQIYRDDKPATDEIEVRDFNGNTFDFIPLFPVGSKSNNFDLDEITLEDIASVNRGHYINSADYEESLHICSQAMLHIDIGDMDAQEFKDNNQNGIKVGSRSGIQTRGGAVEFVQADERSGFNTAREEKQQEMINLGAKVIEDRGGNKTATQSRIDAQGENSVLSDLVNNVEDAYRLAIATCERFMSPSESDFNYTMNRDFFDSDVEPQLIMAAIQLRDRGVISLDDIRDLSRKAKLTDRTNLEIEELVEDESPIGEIAEEPLNVE